MAVSPAVRVGIIVLLAALAFAGVFYFLRGYRVRGAGYPITVVFNDAQGLIEGTEVTMAGVRVGMVQSISLDEDQRAVVRLWINRQYHIPEGSRFVLRVGLLVGEKFVDIVPNRQAERFLQPGARVQGQSPIRVEDLLPDAQKLVANLTEASEGLKSILADKELQGRIDRSFENIEQATASLEQTMAVIQGTAGTIQGIVEGRQEDIRAIVSNVAVASENLRGFTEQLEEFAEEGGVQAGIGGTLTAAQRAAESLERTATSLEKLVTAPQFQEDIRETVSGARKAVEEAQEVLGRVGRVFGGRRAGVPRIPTRGTGVDALYRPDDGRFRATLTTSIPLLGDRFLDLGLYDIGADNKLILQPGWALGPQTDFRLGLYASRLGLGLDHAFSSRAFTSLNAYDPEDPRLDLLTGYNVTDDWGVLLGVDRLLDDNQLTLGVRLTR